MLVFYNKANLKVLYTAEIFDSRFLEHAQANAESQPFISCDAMPVEELELIREGDEIIALRRVPMEIVAPATCRPGETVAVFGVPEGAQIFLDNERIGTMDVSNVLELELETAGFYVLRFEASGYITKEITIEARPEA